jgi:hypothetical protein
MVASFSYCGRKRATSLYSTAMGALLHRGFLGSLADGDPRMAGRLPPARPCKADARLSFQLSS